MTEQAEINPTAGTSTSSSASATIERPAKVETQETPQARWDRIVAVKEGRQPRGADGKFAPVQQEQPEAETQPAKGEAKPVEAAPDKSAPDKSATAALDGLRAPGSLKALAEKDPELAAWLVRINKDRAEASQTIGTLKGKGTKTEPGNVAEGTQAPSQPTSSGNLRDLTMAAAKAVAEDLALDDAGSQKLGGLVKPVLDAFDAFEQRETARDAQLLEMQKHTMSALIGQARAQLSGSLPKLKDDASWPKVYAELKSRLSEQEDSDDPLSVIVQELDNAYAVVFKDDTRRQAEAKTRNQQPSVKEARASAKARFAGVPEHVARHTLLGEGKTPAEVSALLHD